MSKPRFQRLRGSLGDSWGDAEYESDGGASIHSASEISSDVGSDSDFEEQQDMATPLPNRAMRASSRTPQDTPVKTPANRILPRNSESPKSSPQSQPRSYPSTPGSKSLEPSFIMPSMYQPADSPYNGSPLRNSNSISSSMRIPRYRGPSASSSANPSPRLGNRRKPTKRSLQPEADADTDHSPLNYINVFLNYVLWPLSRYLLSIIGHAAEYLKPFIGMACALLVLSFALMAASGYLKAAVQTTLTPLCIIPGSSHFLPFCAYPAQPQDMPYPDFEEAMNIQSSLEDIVYESKDAYKLPGTMKRSEATIRDLRSLVKYSKLPSRIELEVEFTSFIETAGEAVRDLTRFNAKVGHTMDQVLSTNSWTMQVLQGLDEKEASYGLISKLASSLSLTAGSPNLSQHIHDQYVRHVSKIKDDIAALVQNAEALMAILDNLDNRLQLIFEIAIRDGLIVGKNRDELLSQLWTKLGGNRGQRQELERTLALLSKVTQYRKQAAEHVRLTSLRLHDIEAGLENLRDGVAAPEVLGWRDDVPLSYHISIMEKASERLKDARGEARLLEREANRRGLGDEVGEKALPGNSGEMPTVYAKGL
ncbi:hypothetical protein K505DRAFT_326433 [Melanomma pulvis-pyrius CBS 109.77]|uniref:Uncharacterized protein n=1 Tax=Melanomma pulvis-pyrius CBS 109.77 TaxID=1314802 RepID=A0A6A6X6T7_9PLEO|nr:hypothetical protein K505DRAFT_326433 [Melanomma pulvis-pyrius CBS 109.77]